MTTENATAVLAKQLIPVMPDDAVDLPPLDETFDSPSLNCIIGADATIKRAYIRALSGIDEPAAGNVTIGKIDTQGISALEWKKLRTEAALVSGAVPLLSIHHGLMNVMLPLLYHNSFTFLQASERSRKLLTWLGCDFDYTVLPAFMSPIEQRLLSLARGLITRPRILFLDDFFRDLSTQDRRHLYRLLSRVKEEYGLCIVATLSDLSFNWSLCDKIIFVSSEKTVTHETWNEITSTDDPHLLEYLWDENIVARVRPKMSKN